MSRSISFSVGEFYHVYNRGVDKRIIFETDIDRYRFLHLLHLCNSERPVNLSVLLETSGKGSTFSTLEVDVGTPLVAIGAYCLMLNHFHLLLKEVSDNGVSKFMQKLGTAYTMYFNASRQRSGALFQSRFKTKHADTDVYLKYIFSYIHLNPLKIFDRFWQDEWIDTPDAKRFLSSYVFSSYLDYKGKDRELKKILFKNEFPEYFTTRSEFDKSITDWIKLRPED